MESLIENNRVFKTKGRSTSVYIVEGNPLAAEYLDSILARDADLSLKVIRNTSMLPQVPLAQQACVLIASEEGVSRPISAYMAGLKRLFPRSGFIFVGGPEFGRELAGLAIEECIGFVAYSDVSKNLVPAVRRIALGFYTGAISTKNRLFGGIEPELAWPAMTRREIEILDLLRHRLCNKEIANILDIAEVTVKFHVSNIFSKAKVNRRRELLALFEKTTTCMG
jgi:DNA-binding CsgD family transcriptional regulator